MFFLDIGHAGVSDIRYGSQVFVENLCFNTFTFLIILCIITIIILIFVMHFCTAISCRMNCVLHYIV